MSRWATIGFEITKSGTGANNFEGIYNARTSSSAAVVRSGSRALAAVVTASNTAIWEWVANAAEAPGGVDVALNQRQFNLVHFRVPALPGANTRIMELGGNATTEVYIVLTTGGKLQLWNANDTTQIGSDSSHTVAVDTWVALEASILINTGAVDTAEARVNGTSFASASSMTFSDSITDIRRTRLGVLSSAANFTIYFDDFAINNASGGSQNSWPTVDGTYGDGKNKVLLGIPTADSQVGDWTGGAGGTTNLYDALNNTPPIGTATETDLTQIENIVNGGGTNYIATMQSYTTIGVPSGATIGVVQGVISHGEDAATGSKTGQFKIASNPAGSFQTFTFGQDLGALGTWTATWGWGWSAEYAPSVTLGTAPTMELDKTDTGTAVASVCFLGYVVQYNEAVADTLMGQICL